MLYVSIVEDEREAAALLKSYLERFSCEKGLELHISLFEDGEDILKNYPQKLDILFMDIRLKTMDGLSTAARIREFDSNVILIFVTNMQQLAVRGYEVDALDFMVKPIQYQAFS